MGRHASEAGTGRTRCSAHHPTIARIPSITGSSASHRATCSSQTPAYPAASMSQTA